MRVHNAQFIARREANPGQTGKFILNDAVVIFFPGSQQHNSIKQDGLSYEDDYRGNAMAGTFKSSRVDIRYHGSFTHGHVRNIWSRVCAVPEIGFLKSWEAYYQGQKL